MVWGRREAKPGSARSSRAIAGVQATTWAQHPALAAADLYGRTLHLGELDALRPRWEAALDARGPWLRARRPVGTDPALVAVLRDEQGWSQAMGPMLRFASELELELELSPRAAGPRGAP